MPDVWVKPPSLAPFIIPAQIDRQKAILDAERRLNSLGWQIVTNYDLSGNKYPACLCVDVTWDRVMLAAAQVGVALPRDKASDFGRLWYSRIEPKRTWLNLPWVYRGQGAAGAMAYIGLGSLVDAAGIWAGKLRPGAAMQAWNVADDYYRVRDGDPASVDRPGEFKHYGHSFIFLSYVHSDKGIIGMQIADNGFRGGRPFIMSSEFALWFGANHNSGVRLTDLIY
jgi:hypothetical protein